MPKLDYTDEDYEKYGTDDRPPIELEMSEDDGETITTRDLNRRDVDTCFRKIIWTKIVSHMAMPSRSRYDLQCMYPDDTEVDPSDVVIKLLKDYTTRCNRCKMNTMVDRGTVQTRSNDEGAQAFRSCIRCKDVVRISGSGSGSGSGSRDPS